MMKRFSGRSIRYEPTISDDWIPVKIAGRLTTGIRQSAGDEVYLETTCAIHALMAAQSVRFSSFDTAACLTDNVCASCSWLRLLAWRNSCKGIASSKVFVFSAAFLLAAGFILSLKDQMHKGFYTASLYVGFSTLLLPCA